MLTAVTRLVLATVAGLTLAATPAIAQEQPSEVEQPRPLLSAVATCADGIAGLDVRVLDDRDEPYSISVLGTGESGYTKSVQTKLTDNQVHLAVLNDLVAGEYIVMAAGEQAGPADGIKIVVKDCKDIDPAKGELDVEVECKAGWGIVTFVVANPSGEAKQYTLTSSDLSTNYAIDLGDGMFLRITENGFEDGDYFATLTGEGMEAVRKEFTIKCAAENVPTVSAGAACDDSGSAPAFVTVANPNRASVDYTIKVGGQEQVLPVGGGMTDFVKFDPLAPGKHAVTVDGSDGTKTETVLQVDNCAGVDPDEDGLQVEVACADGKSVVTFRFFRTEAKSAAFSVEGTKKFDETVEFDGDEYRWSRYTGEFADGQYTARLKGDGVDTTETFTVKCADEQPTTTTTAPTTTTTPVPQGGTAPSAGDDLPVTGAAVTGIAAVGAAALALGAVLLIVTRRRRTAK